MKKDLTARAAQDRRDEDRGPPCGWKDRRRKAERRIPTVEETDMSESQWLNYFGRSLEENTENRQSQEAAADIFDKHRG
jgi:hypothetical protein